MNILLIPDKFKGSLSAKEVIIALKKGLLKFNPSINIKEVIASDGGDGFLEAIAENDTIEVINVKSVDPLGREIASAYAYNSLDKTAYIELANSSGLSLLSLMERNVLKTSTYGTGIQIKHAIERGAEKIYVGLGGSATNDGGVGIAAALGYEFLDRDNNILEPIGKNLQLISKINLPSKIQLDNLKFFAVNDVKNPLYGREGAAMIYGKQKGGNSKDITILDNGLQNLHKVVKSQLNLDLSNKPGSGAAGGTAYGLKVFFNAEFINGIEFILQKNNVMDHLKNGQIDLIITGEGKIDDQTAFGKLVFGVAQMGKIYDIPVVGICGMQSLKNTTITDLGLTQVLPIHKSEHSIEYTINNASILVENMACNLLKNYI